MNHFARAGIAALAVWLSCVAHANAMPPFAQAYGAKCTTCHTEVPALNSYGRYVQRSGYAVLDHAVLRRSLPVWVGFNPSYDSQDPAAPGRPRLGNVAVHLAGVSGNWSFHVQQWLRQNDTAGTLDTGWVAYNALFGGKGHVFFGKIETPAPSPFSQWFDLSSFASAEVTVGEHQYLLDGNQWGARLAFDQKHFTVDAAWMSESGQKALQWKAAWADANRPLEIGAFGSFGAFQLPEGGADPFRSFALYAQRDPRAGWPGVLAIYQTTFDANSGAQAHAAAGNDATLEFYKPILHGDAVVTARKEFTNDGLGMRMQSGNLDLEYHIARFVHLYTEMYFAPHNKPGYRYMIWWTTPVAPVK